MTKRDRIEIVDWEDITSRGSWNTPEYHAEAGLLLCQSVGFVLAETRKTLVLYQNRHAMGTTIADSITIPKSCIRKRRRIR